MKKIIFAAIAILGFGLSSCEKEDIGGTATQSMAGEWVSNYSGSVSGWFEKDSRTFTFNTSANVPNQMWVSDQGWFLGFQVKVNCDLATMTFSTDGFAENVASDPKVKITNGKITLGGTKTPSGNVADAIEYDLEMENDPGNVYHVTGYRYTGLAQDNI